MATESVVQTVNDENYKVVAAAPTNGASLAQHMMAMNAAANQQIVQANQAANQQIVQGYTQLFFAEAGLQRAGIDVSEGLGRRQEMGAVLPTVLAELSATLAQIRTTNP